VAVLIRQRTKDSTGTTVGTFDDDTEPTADQVETIIDGAYDVIMMRLPAVDRLAKYPALLAGAVQVVALEAACRIEKGYWPEQVRTDRSNYSVLKTELDQALASLEQEADDATGGGDYEFGFVSWPVQSWTGGSTICCPPTTPAP
jgi:hypothetical protein